MEITIHNKQGHKLDILQNYTSIRWIRKYASTGQFEIHASPTDSNVKNLIKNNRLVNKQTKEIGFIKYVHTSKTNGKAEELEIRGYFDNLDDRINSKTHHFGANTENDVYTMISDNKRNLDISFEPKESLLKSNIDMESTWMSLRETIQKVCTLTGFGYRMRAVIDGNSIILNCFSMYDGQIRNVKFSDKLSNITFQEKELDDSDYKNFAYVCATGQDDSRTIVEVDLSNGSDRYELYVDSRNTSKTYRDDDGTEHTYTDSEYQNILKNEGVESLSEHQSINIFSCEVDPNDSLFQFRKDYDLGDIVYVESVKYGINNELYRISEISESDENGEETVEVTLSKYDDETSSKTKGGIV